MRSVTDTREITRYSATMGTFDKSTVSLIKRSPLLNGINETENRSRSTSSSPTSNHLSLSTYNRKTDATYKVNVCIHFA